MRLRALLCIALLTAASLTVPSAALAATCGNSTNATAGQSAARRPVILVHGWTSNGKGMEGTGRALADRTGKRIQPFYFDYGGNSTTWAANPAVAGCLATYIETVSDAYTRAGGDGKIILVGHSMGGLASLYAAQQKPTGDRIGGLITFDTPYLGSPFGDTGVAGWWQGLQQTFGKLVPPLGSDAQICLASHRDGAALANGCDADLPGYLPVGAGLTAIAGDVTVNRTFGPIHLYDIPLSSDGIVSVDSQHGYLRIQRKASWPKGQKVQLKTDACTITNDSMMRTLKGGGRGGVITALLSAYVELKVDDNALDGLLEERLTPALVAYLGAATLTAECSHIRVTGHGPALDMAAAALREYLDQLEPATKVQNLAPVTAKGTVAAGWSVIDGADRGGVDCSFNSASPAARKGDIYFCSPSAAMADACWVEAGENSILCLSDPMTRSVVRLWMEGSVGAQLPTGPAEYTGTPAPIRLDLDSGARCRLRNGGSWGIQENNPDLVGAYGCDNGDVIWTERGSSTGINQSQRMWTVRAGGETGDLTTHKVKTAYYVTTA